MPVDGVLIGTAAMATKEATTSAAVKKLLVDTPGITRAVNGGWVGAGRSDGSVTSGRSQLGADIHEIDNAASRCGALLDQVAGDAEAALARKDELVAAMDQTSKPYFGDVAEMTYEQLLRRYLELSGPRDGSGWLDITFRSRFEDLLDRALARVHPQTSGQIERIDADLDAPSAAIDTLVAEYPEAGTCALHPADVHFFIEVCRRPGKPVNFVPVIDADVRRWWRSDSLWQAHDESYGADQVIVIPGPVAVGGITVEDEPVADLLDRFEAAIVEDLRAHDTLQIAAASRTTVGEGTTLIDAAFDSPDVVWAGRVVPNPLHRLEGTSFALVPDGDDSAVLEVPLSRGDLQPALRPVRGREWSAAGDLRGFRHRRHGCPAGAHGGRHAAGGHADRLGRHRRAPHALVARPGRRPHRRHQPGPYPPWRRGRRPGGAVPSPTRSSVSPGPRSSPASAPSRVCSTWSTWTTGSTLRHLPTDATELSIAATRAGVVDTTAGQVISVDVRISAGEARAWSPRLHERFMVRGRTGSAELAAPVSVAPDAEDKPPAPGSTGSPSPHRTTWVRSPP